MIATVSNALISAILDGVPLSEAQKAGLLEEADLDADVVRDVNERTSILVLSRMWARVLDLTGDPFVGLDIGHAVPPDRFGLAVHAATHSEDLRQVLQRFVKFAPLINGMIQCRLDEEDGVARFGMKFYWDVLGLERHAVDITFVGLLTWARRYLARFALREVRLRHSLASAEPRYREVFGAPVVLGAPRNEMVLDAADLDQVVLEKNLQLGCLLSRFATAELSAIPVLASLPERIIQILGRELQRGNRADLATVCAELRMPERYLQRKLQESSTSFSALRDDVRRTLAPAMLKAPSANVEQVGWRLGFAEPTAFIRAFKKWYGLTPGAYRQRSLSSGADQAGA